MQWQVKQRMFLHTKCLTPLTDWRIIIKPVNHYGAGVYPLNATEGNQKPLLQHG